MAGTPPPVPPYTAAQVAEYDKSDLDLTMKTRMVNWLFAVANWREQTPDAPSGWRNLGNSSGMGGDGFFNILNRMDPTALKQLYLSQLSDYQSGKLKQSNPGGIGIGENVPKVSIPNPLHTMEDFIGAVTNPNLWIRVAEFGVGAILIAVGLNAVLRPGKSLPSINPVRKVLA